MEKTTLVKIILAGSLIAIGIVGRLLLKDWPNIETVTAAALIAGALLGWRWGAAIALVVIAGSDIFIGNNLIMVFTWSAFALIGVGGWLLHKKASFTPKFTLQMTGLGLGAAVFFYIYTNFGVWLLFPMYPHTWAGLSACYVAAIPFFRYSLASALITIPVATVGFTYLQKWLAARFAVPVKKQPAAITK